MHRFRLLPELQHGKHTIGVEQEKTIRRNPPGSNNLEFGLAFASIDSQKETLRPKQANGVRCIAIRQQMLSKIFAQLLLPSIRYRVANTNTIQMVLRH